MQRTGRASCSDLNRLRSVLRPPLSLYNTFTRDIPSKTVVGDADWTEDPANLLRDLAADAMEATLVACFLHCCSLCVRYYDTLHLRRFFYASKVRFESDYRVFCLSGVVLRIASSL